MRVAALLFCLLLCKPAFAKSVYTPRDSGTEPPGGPSAPIGLPQSSSFGRTPDGGMGYTDAYGNPLVNTEQKPKAHRRLPQGAFGRYGRDPDDRPLPEPAKSPQRPAWAF